MEQHMRGTVKKDIASVPVLAGLNPVEEEFRDFAEQLRIANVWCDAVDMIVESRSAAIVAIKNGHMASLTAQLQLMLSKFPEHIRKMPMKKFLKQHCPNTIASTHLDGTLHFDLAALKIRKLQIPGSLNFNTGFAWSVQNMPGDAPSETSMIHIVSPKD